MNRIRPLFLLSVAALSLVLVACGNKATNDNLVRVKSGMTQEEVKKILGKPTKIETGEILGLSGTTFYYEKGESRVQISFINDQVTAKLGTFQE